MSFEKRYTRRDVLRGGATGLAVLATPNIGHAGTISQLEPEPNPQTVDGITTRLGTEWEPEIPEQYVAKEGDSLTTEAEKHIRRSQIRALFKLQRKMREEKVAPDDVDQHASEIQWVFEHTHSRNIPRGVYEHLKKYAPAISLQESLYDEGSTSVTKDKKPLARGTWQIVPRTALVDILLLGRQELMQYLAPNELVRLEPLLLTDSEEGEVTARHTSAQKQKEVRIARARAKIEARDDIVDAILREHLLATKLAHTYFDTGIYPVLHERAEDFANKAGLVDNERDTFIALCMINAYNCGAPRMRSVIKQCRGKGRYPRGADTLAWELFRFMTKHARVSAYKDDASTYVYAVAGSRYVLEEDAPFNHYIPTVPTS